MNFLIVLNNKELVFLTGLLLLFISNDNFSFKFLKDKSLDYLVVTIEELANMCHNRNANFVGI
jgi:hypothetical protein